VTGLLVTGLSIMGQPQGPSIQARDTLNKGVSAFRNGDYQSAIVLFKQAVDLDPSFTAAELYLASAYAQTFLPGVNSPENLALADNAIESFQRVLRQDPDNTQAMLGLAGMYQNTQKFQDAHDTFLMAAKLDPQNPITFYSVGAIDWMLVFDKKNPLSFGQMSVLIEEGLTNLDTALALNPKYEDAMTYKNLLLREKAGLAMDPQEKARLNALADEWFNRALETRKTNGQTGGAGLRSPRAIAPPPPPPPPPSPQQQLLLLLTLAVRRKSSASTSTRRSGSSTGCSRSRASAPSAPATTSRAGWGRQSVRDQLRTLAVRRADGNEDELPAFMHVGHRQTGLHPGHRKLSDVRAGFLVVRMQERVGAVTSKQ
jgi:tetratricopeptide (TPR) repeat protein